MLCPEVWNFPPPKTVATTKDSVDLEFVKEKYNLNYYYKSFIITCPDELNVPDSIEEMATEDNDYYMISKCSVTVFMETSFVENFVKTGKLFCLSAGKDCIVQNCAAITPCGMLVLYILEYNYQTLGLEGTKQTNGFYQIQIDLTNTKQLEKQKKFLQKLEAFDFYLTWEPNNQDICPSSIAKYLFDQNLDVQVKSCTVEKISPTLTEIPSLDNADLEEIAEWIGMLALKADLSPDYEYVSTYSIPESDNTLKTTRLSLLIVKGFITPSLLHRLCVELSEHASSRDVENYWTSLSVQSYTDCLWRWIYSAPSVFQSHDSSITAFFDHNGTNKMFSIGQIKVS